MCSIGPAHFAAFLRRFLQEQPGVGLTLADSTADRLAHRLLAGEFDAALVSRPECHGERLNTERLYAERTVVACAPDHPFAQRQEITMADMDGQTYLLRINCEIRD